MNALRKPLFSRLKKPNPSACLHRRGVPALWVSSWPSSGPAPTYPTCAGGPTNPHPVRPGFRCPVHPSTGLAMQGHRSAVLQAPCALGPQEKCISAEERPRALWTLSAASPACSNLGCPPWSHLSPVIQHFGVKTTFAYHLLNTLVSIYLM